MARKLKSKSFGCFNLIVLLIGVGWVFSFLNGESNIINENSLESESVDISSDVSASYIRDEEKAQVYLKSVGINLSEYYSESVEMSKADYRGKIKKISHNYENFTVENINEFFFEKNRSLKEVVQRFGHPDSMIVVVVGEKYHTTMWWKKEEGDNIIGNYISAEWTEPTAEHSVNNLYGTPSNSSTGKAQSFLGLEGFKFAE